MSARPTTTPFGHRLLPALLVGLIALVLAGSFAAVRSHRLGGVHSFVLAGTQYVDPAQTQHELLPLTPAGGYDGQFVYRLTYDPLTTHLTEHGITFDTPTYRQGRILLPAAAWVVHGVTRISRGQAIELVNVLAVGLAGFAGALLARALHRSEVWGLLLALQPGVIVGLARDINEPLEWALLLLGITLWLRGRCWLAAPLLALSVLARETALFVVAGLGIAVLVDARQQREPFSSWAVKLLPLLPTPIVLLAWELYLRVQWHGLPSANSGTSFDTPVIGIFRSIRDGFTEPTHYYTTVHSTQLLWSFERIGLGLVVLTAGYLLVRGGGELNVRCALVLPLIAALCLHSWAYSAQFQRAALEASGMGALVLLASKPRWAQWLAAALPALALAVAVEFWTYP